MARKLEFLIEGTTVGLELAKIERSKLYGSSSIEAYDETGQRCELVSLANDGKTLIGEGGYSIQIVTMASREIVNRDELVATDLEGKPIGKIESSFNAPIPILERATIEEYLSSVVKSVYSFAKSEDRDTLQQFLSDGSIYKFDFSYRGGIVADTCFLLSNVDGIPFMIVTSAAKISFVGFDDSVGLETEMTDDIAVDEIDFDMF